MSRRTVKDGVEKVSWIDGQFALVPRSCCWQSRDVGQGELVSRLENSAVVKRDRESSRAKERCVGGSRWNMMQAIYGLASELLRSGHMKSDGLEVVDRMRRGLAEKSHSTKLAAADGIWHGEQEYMSRSRCWQGQPSA